MPNEVYANSMSISCKAGNGKSICAFPDVCFTPPLTPATPPGVPIPYPNTGMAMDTSDGSTSVKISNQEVMLKNKSSFSKSMGDEAGAAPKKGMLTSKNMGKVFFNMWSMDVKVEGENVVRMLDITTHNHGSVPGNTPPFPHIDKVGVAVDAAATEKEKKGTLKVTVVDKFKGDKVKDAKVTVNDEEKTTGDSGEVSFPDLPEGTYDVDVKLHVTDADFVRFAVHYPRVLINGEAKSSQSSVQVVEDGQTVEASVPIEVYRLIPNMIFYRRHIVFNAGPDEDKYGHWWTKVNSNLSYGWWPKYPIGHPKNRRNTPPTKPNEPAPDAGRMAQVQHLFSSAVYAVQQKMFNILESGPMQTFRGVEGELNGQTSFGGTKTRDPHELGGDDGDDQYQAVVCDDRSDSDIRDKMSTYAKGYSGGWSWRFEFGNHCHTFQKKLMSEADVNKFKKIK